MPEHENDKIETITKHWTGRSALVAMLLYSGTAAAQWHIDPVLRVGWDYDDNATLSIRTDNEEQISGPIGEASIDFSYASETTTFSLRPTFRTRNYEEEFNRDSDDQFLRLRTGYEGVRNQLTFLGDYGRESVRTAELADADLDVDEEPEDIPDDDIACNNESGAVILDPGCVGIRQRRERLRVLPRWTYQLSDASSLVTDVSFLTVDYEDVEAQTNLFDFTDARFNLSYRRRFSARNTGILALTARDYQTDNIGGDSSGWGVSAGFNRDISETTRLRALVGVEQSDLDNPLPGQEDLDPSFVTDISLTRRLETIRLLAQYRQRVAASGRGGLRRRDEINLRLTRDLNQKISAGLGVRAYAIDSLENDDNEQNYVQLRGQFVWRITPAFSFQTDYRFTLIDRETLGESANSNQVTVWLSYQPNARGLSQPTSLR